jgi:hypothetical protein
MKEPRKSAVRFAVCIKNKGDKASLEIGKLYRVIPDKGTEEHGYLRIVDESGEDYGYAADRFFSIEVPKPFEKAFLMAASRSSGAAACASPRSAAPRRPERDPGWNRVHQPAPNSPRNPGSATKSFAGARRRRVRCQAKMRP